MFDVVLQFLTGVVGGCGGTGSKKRSNGANEENGEEGEARAPELQTPIRHAIVRLMRTRLYVALVAGGLTLLAVAPAFAQASRARQPNVLLIMADDLNN